MKVADINNKLELANREEGSEGVAGSIFVAQTSTLASDSKAGRQRMTVKNAAMIA